MKFALRGMGTSHPPYSFDQDNAVEAAQTICCSTDQQRQWMNVVYRRSGIDRRYSVLLDNGDPGIAGRQSFYPPRVTAEDKGPTTAQRMARYETESPPLAVEAARRALCEADCDPASLSHLVTVSCSGFASPGYDFALIRELGLSAGITRTNVGFMGCHGALIGLRTAGAFARAEPGSRVLMCAVELCTLHQQYGWDPQQIVAGGLFADGAAAVVGWVEPDDAAGWGVVRHGSVVLPNSEECMGWRVGDTGFEMRLTPEVPDQVARHLGDWVKSWLAESGLSLADVKSWAVHPGGPRVLTASAESLGLPTTALATSHAVFREYGNMSSPTIVFILERLKKEAAATPCVALAFGPGLSIEAALIV
ncbi:MAG: type III polyketide synthase [Planctomycetota bacterium]|nr:type III polyketide synthase [Planctomycetota bacterium]